MSKKITLVLLALLAFCIMQVAPAMADETKTAPARTEHKEAAAKAGGAMHHHGMAANEVAVCACGKVFHPDANTKFIEANGKSYACCSDKCHEMGSKDPAAAAKMADDHMAKMMAPGTAPAQK
jgi:hypothetical protein